MNLQGDDAFDYVRCCVNALVNLKFELINVKEEEANNIKEKKGIHTEVSRIRY